METTMEHGHGSAGVADPRDGMIVHSVTAHPVTGLNNGKFGIWLFLASEVMLFGALFSAYVLIRVGSPIWPHGRDMGLNIPMGMLNTFVLIGSSVTMVFSWLYAQHGDLKKSRMFLLITLACSAAFLVVKFFEYKEKFELGHLPRTNNFYALYFLITGLHGIHILGGMVVMLYLVGPGAKLFATNPKKYEQRLECTGLYWHFVDLVWIFLFPVLYLL